MKKITVVFLCVCMLTALLCAASAEAAQNVVRATLTGNSVNIHSEPSSKSKVYTQASRSDFFLLDSTPIRDESDNSEWYKILFIIGIDYDIFQAHKLSEYDFSYPYVSAVFVEKEPLTDYDQRQLDYLKQGRPPRIKVGDDFSEYGPYTSHVLQAPVTLRKEPKNDAEKILLPAGTIILYSDEWMGWSIYHDMDDTAWGIRIGEDQKVLGWTTLEDGKKICTMPLKGDQ